MMLHLSISGVAVASGPPKSVGAFRVAADEALVVTMASLAVSTKPASNMGALI